MKDFLRCDNCGAEVHEDQAFNWWEARRIYPVTLQEAKDGYDFCSYTCLELWIIARRGKVK